MRIADWFSSCLCVFAVLIALFALAGCEAERRKSDAELGLNAQQSTGRKLYDNYCDRCHEPYSSRGKKGPSLKGVFKQQYLPLSGHTSMTPVSATSSSTDGAKWKASSRS